MTQEHTATEFDFWSDHSLEYLEMALRQDYRERIDNPDGHGKRTGECSDTVEFFLMQTNGVLTTVAYDIDGCMNTNACANTVVEMAMGKSIDSAWEISEQDVLGYLKTLPAHDTHCAELAVGAFYLALKNLTDNLKKK